MILLPVIFDGLDEIDWFKHQPVGLSVLDNLFVT